MIRDLSVVIVTYNSAGEIDACLSGLYADLGCMAAEVIVVDSASDDDTAARVRGGWPLVTLIRLSENRGFAAGNNVGLGRARGAAFLLLNPDTIVHRDAIRALLAVLCEHSGVASVGPLLLNADGSVQPSCREFPGFLGDLVGMAELYRLSWVRRMLGRWMPSLGPHDRPRSVEWVSGACLLVRRTACEQAGPMDAGYFMYSEELDWQYRMARLGWTVRFEPRARVTHLGGASTASFAGDRIVWQYRSLLRFYRLHRGRLRTALQRALIWLVTWPKVIALLPLSAGNPRRRALLNAFWRVLWLP